MNYDTEKLKTKLAALTERRAEAEKALQQLEAQRQNGIANLNALTGAILIVEEMLKELDPAPKE